MKKLLCLFSLLLVTLSAHAGSRCIIYTTQELNEMRIDELEATIVENKEKISDNSGFLASAEDKVARQTCLIQNQRVTEVLEKKRPKTPPGDVK